MMNSGNDPLAQLHPLIEPAAPSLWPLAIGWWLVIATVAISVVLTALWWRRRYRLLGIRRVALSELDKLSALRNEQTSQRYVQQLNQLLKRVARHYYPPITTTLSGDAWLDFLHRSGGKALTNIDPNPLRDGPYRPVDWQTTELEQLHARARDWIKRQPGKFDVHA